MRLITVDSKTAVPTVTIDERSDTFVCYSQKSFLHRVEGADEWIWMSERSGWNHMYLMDAQTGQVKHPITSGEWGYRTELNLAHAFIHPSLAQLGREMELDSCGKRIGATVISPSPYDPDFMRMKA